MRAEGRLRFMTWYSEAAYVASTIDHSTSAEAAAAGDTSDISTKTIGTIN